jgi:integrase
MAKITKRTVDDAEVRAAEYFIWCDELPGFGIRIYPSGARGYLVQYRAAGRTRRAKIGLHGRLTPEEARKQAKILLGQVAKGDDPAEDRATQRATITVKELCERYRKATAAGLILGKGGTPKKASTGVADNSRIDRHIVPLLGTRKVADLTRSDIARFLRDVVAGKTARVAKTDNLRGKSIVSGGSGAAARTVGLLGGILSYAVSEGIIAANPVHGVRRPADQRKTARLTPETYKQLGTGLRQYVAEGGSKQAANTVWLLALTGCRKSEIEKLKWAEVDLPGQALRLKDSKEGASVRPLGGAARDVLAGIDRVKGNDYVLVGKAKGRPYGGMSNAWPAIMKKAGLTGISPHTLRHSFASTAGDLGYTEATIGAMLGHTAATITGRYVHHLDAVLLAAADKVAEAVREQMS